MNIYLQLCNHWIMGLTLPFLTFLFFEDALCAPYGGYGPKEEFGNTGNTFPAPNPNAIFGYDYFNIFDDWTTYGSVYNQHKNRTLLLNRRPKKHVNSPVLPKAAGTAFTEPIPKQKDSEPLAQY
eukprot:TCALIF_08758-PA protein Name:"Protein of unknown function" AED:0.19 eAED:0.19 QI:240/1/0.66/1/0.5/0/3/0/123